MAALTLSLSACATSRPLRPLEKGQLTLTASLPAVWLQSFGATYPFGTPVVGARYGVATDWELRGDVHLGGLPRGVIGIDLGTVWHLWPAEDWLPALHLEGTLNATMAPAHFARGPAESIKGAAELGLLVHWEPLDWLWPYVVSEHTLTFEFARYITSLMVGAQMWITPRVAVSVEIGWAGFNLDARRYTQRYVSIADHGALWMGLGLEVRGSKP